MKIALIVAMDTKRGIGKNNDLMWHLATDMKFFKETTNGHVVVMGRKNWDSIPQKYRPLSHRENVVLSRNLDFQANDCRIFHSLEDCLDYYKEEKQKIIFIIGGSELYKQALYGNYVQEMFITHVNATYDADTFFPPFDLTEWTSQTILTCQKDSKNEASFEVVHYVKKSIRSGD